MKHRVAANPLSRPGTWALLLGWAILARAGHPEFSPIPEIPNSLNSLWQPFLTVRAATGYRSNPLFAQTPEGTGFASTGVDLFLLRLPTGATTFTAFFSGEDVRYFNTLRPVTNEPGATQERTYLTDVRLGHGLGSATNWVLKFEGRHLYNDQFLNTSSIDSLSTNLSSLRAVTHTGTVIPGVAWEGLPHGHLELSGIATRQLFLHPDTQAGLSSTWEIGPRLIAGWRSPTVGTLDLELSGVHREFDDRVQSSSLGLPLAGTRLRQDDLRTELAWRRHWGLSNQWQNTVRLFHVWRRENGEGYTDYDRLGVTGSLRYEAKCWSARLTGRWSTYDYPRSFIVFGGILAVPRERESRQIETRLEYKLSSRTRLWGEYQWERELANRVSDNYTAHIGTLGWEYDF